MFFAEHKRFDSSLILKLRNSTSAKLYKCNRKTGTFSMEVKKSVDKGVSNAKFRNSQNAQISKLFWCSQGICQRKYTAGSIYSAKGLLHLAQWCTGLTWGFCFWFGLHACMGVCLSLCVSPLSPPSTCCWIRGRQQPNDSLFTTCLSERERHSGVCPCVCEHVHFAVSKLSKEHYTLAWLLSIQYVNTYLQARIQ